MQFKHLEGMGPLSGPFQLMWNRISFSRLTLFYFLFSVAHFIIQLSFQIKAFTINADAASFLSRIVNEAKTTNSSLPFLQDSSTLRLCSWVPSDLNVDVTSCPVVWSDKGNVIGLNTNIAPTYPSPSATSTLSQGTLSTKSVSTTSTIFSAVSTTTLSEQRASTTLTSSPSRQTITVFVVPQASPTPKGDDDEDDNDDDDDEQDEHSGKRIRRDINIIPSQEGESVSVTLVGLGQQDVVLDDTCLWALNWPVSVLNNTKREDIVFVAFQFWVLGMSIVALLNESIPHIVASLLTHMLATAWASFQITHTANFRADFNRVITNGACKGVSLLPSYWSARSAAEIPSLVLNVLALLISVFLTWKLIKLFGWQTFKRVGASLTINRIYKLVLTLSITIQLALFFMVVTVSLWIDQLMNSVIGDLVDFLKLYKASSFIVLALLVPWLMTGWFAVRRELRMPMFIFLLLSILYLGAWGVMFFSTTFRWTFITWRFFSIMAGASVLLTCMSFVLGVICRYNFGKGLARYLNGQQSLLDDDVENGYGSDDVEKVAFPSSDKPLPTYASHNDLPYSTYSGSTLGPRFSNPSAEPFETTFSNVTLPQAALKRHSNEAQVYRSNSHGSSKSGNSSIQNAHIRSDSSHSHGSQNSHTKRWVIE